jgi:hypothetical protein
VVDQILINEIIYALGSYRKTIAGVNDTQSKEDCLRLIVIAERMIAAAQAHNMAELKLGVLSFSRQVSNFFVTQPPAFKALANKIAEVKKASDSVRQIAQQ